MSARLVIPLGSCRVLLADATLMGCELLASALQRHPEFNVATCVDRDKVLQFAVDNCPHVAVVSARMDDNPAAGLELIPRLRELSPSTRIIVLLDSSRFEVVVQSFRHGAHGVFCRTDSHKLLARCINSVHEGQIWANSAQLQMAMDAFSGRTPVYGVDANAEGLLGRREQEVVSLVACGLSNRGIAQKLQISEHTVKNYLFRVYEKLGISNRVELALFALSSKRRANGHRPLRQPVCRVPQSTSENLLSDPLLRA